MARVIAADPALGNRAAGKGAFFAGTRTGLLCAVG